MKAIIVIPTYNEADNLPKMIEALWALPQPDLSVLVVDDNSPDGTGNIADQLAARYPARLGVIHRPAKSGLGTAYIEGFTRALDQGAEAILQMDADFSHSPSYIPKMIECLSDYDVIVGSRYVPGGKLDQRWEFGRYLLSWFANSVYARLLLNIHV